MAALLLCCIAQEGANAGKLASRRRSPKPFRAALGKEGAKVGSHNAEQRLLVDRFAAMLTKEGDQPVGRCDISANGVRGTAAIMLKIVVPARGQRTGRMVG